MEPVPPRTERFRSVAVPTRSVEGWRNSGLSRRTNSFVPGMGMIGAGIATLGGFALLAVGTGVVGQRYYPVRWDLPRVTGALLIAGGLAGAALLGPDTVAWRLGCIAVYPLAVIALRIVEPRDLERIGAAVRRRLPRR